MHENVLFQYIISFSINFIKGNSYGRKFNKDYYNKHEWLCGCSETMSLFCFPCLLFGGDDAWTKNGFKNISKISARCKSHEKSTRHIDNIVSFNLLGKSCMRVFLSQSYKESIDKHNEEVKKNRKVLSILIDSVLFCGFQEIALRGHVEKEDSLNPGSFRSLLTYASKLDNNLKEHLEKSTVFKGVSSTIQNEILECILELYRKEIISQVSKTPFIAIIADETTDVAVKNQLSIVIRYVHDCRVVERFWGFFQPERVNADGIAEVIMRELATIVQGDSSKVVAQTYDGASVMKGRIGGVHVKVKQVYRNAYYVHCAAHKLNLILSMAASCNREAKLFFAKLDQIPTFFSKSPERKRAMVKSIPSGSKTRWNYNSRTVCSVANNLSDLLTGFESITNNTDRYGYSTIAAAENCLKTLRDEKFLFWLNVFAQLMPEVDILYNVMQSTKLTVPKVEEHLNSFKSAVDSIRNSNHTVHVTTNLSASAKEVCDSVRLNVAERFKFSGHLRIAQLFVESNFCVFLSCFPLDLIQVVENHYPVVDCKHLKNELKIFYRRKEMHKGGLVKILLYLEENNLRKTFNEITKLLKLQLKLKEHFQL